MRLYIIGFGCMLFFSSHIEAATKITIAQHVTTSGDSHHCGCGCDPSIQTPKVDDLYTLPYDGGILSAKGEYIPGSISEVWAPVLANMAHHLEPEGREVLSHFEQHFDEFNTALLRKDNRGCAKLFHKYVVISNEVIPFYKDEGYRKACDGANDGMSQLMKLDHNLCTPTGANITLLQQINEYLKPLANRLYHASMTYHPTPLKSIDKC